MKPMAVRKPIHEIEAEWEVRRQSAFPQDYENNEPVYREISKVGKNHDDISPYAYSAVDDHKEPEFKTLI